MAMPVTPIEIGIDVSQEELVIARSDQAGLETIANDPAAIRCWLKTLPGPARVGVEATNTFHVALVEAAHRARHTVYVVDGYCLKQYRKALRGRAKTDASDARLLRRYVSREWPDLRPWSPPSAGYRRLQRLVHRRAVVTQAKQRLRQSLKDLPELKQTVAKSLRTLKTLEDRLTQAMQRALRTHDWRDDAERCQAIEGIGEVIAPALVMAFHRGRFRSSDAFIAFIGYDVRVRQSGKYQGQRKLTKQGDPELRRLLYLAAMTARRTATWEPYYQRCLDRGLTTTQALVALARKLARVAFALLKNQTTYVPQTAS
ncbi:MAG TPA: IS110 family transposase [Chromatiales bacterium]|nr:IS110 family transposase [Chromatiales bacterium]